MLKMEFVKEYIKIFKQLFTIIGIIESLPVIIIFGYAYSTSLIPVNLYYRYFSTPIFEYFYVNNLTLLAPVLIPIIILNHKVNFRLLLISFGFFCIFAFSTFFAKDLQIDTIMIALYSVIPFCSCAFIKFTRIQIKLIRLNIAFSLFILVAFQVYFYGLGFGTYVSSFGDGTAIGEIGVASSIYKIQLELQLAPLSYYFCLLLFSFH